MTLTTSGRSRWIRFSSATVTCLAVLSGCGAKQSGQSGSTGGGASPAGGTLAATSAYDAGPRAGEQPIDETQVAVGKKLFSEKGCTACHAFGKKLACPDLNGVTMRRTALWMENQILHPEVMTKEDPIAHQLFAQYALQMTNQHLTPEEARAVIEFLKHTNHESQEASNEKKGD